MKKYKNNLDEMQEQKLLKIEHRGYQIAFWGLSGAVCIQSALENNSFAHIGGEMVILLALSLYMLLACLKNGIWDRWLKPDWKTNLTLSLICGFLFGCFWSVANYYRYHNTLGTTFLIFLIMSISITVSILALLSLTSAIYKRKKHQLEDLAEKEENE